VRTALGGLFAVSDHRNHRRRASEPAWPTGDDPEPRASGQKEERTGFWSPLWEDDDEPPAKPANGHGRRAQSNPQARKGGDGGSHRWPDAEPPAAPRRAEPPAKPRPSQPRRGAAPAWPSGEEAPPPPRRAGGPHTPPPGARNGSPPPGQATRVVRPRPGGPQRPGAPGRPGPAPGEGPTEVMRPSHRGTGPEPQLLTHREPDYDEDLNDDPDLYDDEDYDDRPLSADDRKLRRRKIWRRVRRTMYVGTALGIIGPILAFFIAYQNVDVPSPEAVAADQNQVVTLKYGNGDEMTKIVPSDGGTRQMITYKQLPEVVKNAVFAAEDADFMQNPGFDISGVMRAGWNQVTGGAGGGSTITQQYIKMATGDDEASYTRKALEVVKAYKMNNTYTKEKILESYLNTIYFGRGAYGIAAAGKAYFDTELDALTPSQAALLGGMIQSPGRYNDQAYMERRWKFVMDQMVDKGWLPAADRKAATFPTLIPMENARPQAIQGVRAHIQNAVLDEVERNAKLTPDQLQQKGYTIETTIDKPAQDAAEKAVGDWAAKNPANLLPALVAVNPKNGEVIAYYGGANGQGIDWASTRQEPGSSFKPFDLVALLEEGKGLGETYNGTSGRQFGGPDSPKIRNAGGASCGENCTVAEAMKRSINTVFYDIALNEVGTGAVANAAYEAGVTSDLKNPNGGAPDGNIAIGGGTTRVTTLEMASAYATFAAGGMYRAPHLVKRIANPDGSTYWSPDQGTVAGKQAFDDDPDKNQKIARNVTEALLPIPEFNEIECAGNRKCAAKTGTHQLGEDGENSKAWTVGYTPQVSAAVSLAGEENGKQVALKDKNGKNISGGGGPGKIWQAFMNLYLKDLPKEGFGKFEPIGKKVQDAEDDEKKTDNRSSNSQTSTTTTTTTTENDDNNGQTTTNEEETSNPDDTGEDGPGPPDGVLPTFRTG
jgi:membrane peptidoglycan carboxypeptidase